MLIECYLLLPMGWWDENGSTHRQKPSNKKSTFFSTKLFVKHPQYLPITCAKIPRSLVQKIQKRRRHIGGSPSEPFGRRWPTQGFWWKTWRQKQRRWIGKGMIIDSQYDLVKFTWFFGNPPETLKSLFQFSENLRKQIVSSIFSARAVLDYREVPEKGDDTKITEA